MHVEVAARHSNYQYATYAKTKECKSVVSIVITALELVRSGKLIKSHLKQYRYSIVKVSKWLEAVFSVTVYTGWKPTDYFTPQRQTFSLNDR